MTFCHQNLFLVRRPRLKDWISGSCFDHWTGSHCLGSVKHVRQLYCCQCLHWRLLRLTFCQFPLQVNSHELELQVRRQCDALIEAVERRKSELISSISQHRLRKHQSFNEHMSECTTKLHRNTGLLQFAIETLKESDPSAFLLVKICILYIDRSILLQKKTFMGLSTRDVSREAISIGLY